MARGFIPPKDFWMMTPARMCVGSCIIIRWLHSLHSREPARKPHFFILSLFEKSDDGSQTFGEVVRWGETGCARLFAGDLEVAGAGADIVFQVHAHSFSG
jgi:hypothetical protein